MLYVFVSWVSHLYQPWADGVTLIILIMIIMMIITSLRVVAKHN